MTRTHAEARREVEQMLERLQYPATVTTGRLVDEITRRTPRQNRDTTALKLISHALHRVKVEVEGTTYRYRPTNQHASRTGSRTFERIEVD